MDDILNTVKSSLHTSASALNGTSSGDQRSQDMQVDSVVYSEYQDGYEDQQWDYDANEVVFDDTGEGVGIEGDLDVEDD